MISPTFAVAPGQDGQRLDLFLCAALPPLSRKRIKRALDSGQVQLNGQIQRVASTSVRVGDVVVYAGDTTALAPVTPPSSLDLIFRDDHLLAINKPAGLPCHANAAGKPHALGLVTALLQREGRETPPILLHRLDEDTSGVLVFALTAAANRSLSRQFADRRTDKIYLALVAGTPPERCTVRNFLKAKVRGRTLAVRSGGQPAETRCRCLWQGEDIALVACKPLTGRTHQIRVHLAGEGLPILGDRLYGGPTAVPQDGNPLRLSRHLLHAAALSFTHPGSGAPCTISAPLPDDMQALLPASVVAALPQACAIGLF